RITPPGSITLPYAPVSLLSHCLSFSLMVRRAGGQMVVHHSLPMKISSFVNYQRIFAGSFLPRAGNGRLVAIRWVALAPFVLASNTRTFSTRYGHIPAYFQA